MQVIGKTDISFILLLDLHKLQLLANPFFYFLLLALNHAEILAVGFCLDISWILIEPTFFDLPGGTSWLAQVMMGLNFLLILVDSKLLAKYLPHLLVVLGMLGLSLDLLLVNVHVDGRVIHTAEQGKPFLQQLLLPAGLGRVQPLPVPDKVLEVFDGGVENVGSPAYFDVQLIEGVDLRLEIILGPDVLDDPAHLDDQRDRSGNIADHNPQGQHRHEDHPNGDDGSNCLRCEGVPPAHDGQLVVLIQPESGVGEDQEVDLEGRHPCRHLHVLAEIPGLQLHCGVNVHYHGRQDIEHLGWVADPHFILDQVLGFPVVLHTALQVVRPIEVVMFCRDAHRQHLLGQLTLYVIV